MAEVEAESLQVVGREVTVVPEYVVVGRLGGALARERGDSDYDQRDPSK